MEYDEKHQKILDLAVSLLRENLQHLVAIIVFGTFGSEYERPDSDLDIAVLTDENHRKLDPVELWQLAQTIAIKIGRDVDLIDLRSASTVFNFEILSSGTTVYCSDESALAKYDTMAFSLYLRFQEERKDILMDFEKEAFNDR